ncbi:MAG: peptidylprolyl isomerase [Pseudomonadota bacterium]
MRLLISITVALLWAMPAVAQDPLPSYPRVKFATTEGDIVLELDARRAPLTVEHFVKLVEDGYYDGTIFHRVIPGFVAQAGGYDRNLKSVESEGTVVNESGNGLRNLRGTVAMARLPEPHTANAQFFINLADNRSLDPQGNRWGYAVFGTVIEGLDVVDQIAALPTGPGGEFTQDVPVVRVTIEKAERVDP